MSRILVDALVVSDESGFACSKSKLVESGVWHLRPFNISNDGQLDLSEVYQVPEREAPAGKTRLEAGDILFNNTNSAELVGKAALVSDPMEAGFSNHLTRIRLNANLVEPAYFAFWLRRLRGQGFFTAQATQWVSQAAYKTSELRKSEIDLPPLDEQRRIVDLLARAEGIVRLRREAEKKAAELIPALFLDMFGDPARNPKGWPTKNLGDFCRIIGGSSLPPGEPFTGQAEGRLLMKVSDMNATGNEVFVVSCKEWIPDQKRSYSSVGAGTIVFPKRGAAIATNKKRITTRPTLLDPNLMGVLPDEKVARTDYLFQWFSAFDLADISSGTTVPQLNKGDLSPLVVPIAPLNLQDKFQEKRAAMLSIQSQQSAATAKAQETFDALLAGVFSAG